MQLVVAILIAFAAFFGLALIAFVAWACWEFYKILRDLRDQIRVMNSSLTGVPALLEGIKAICRDLALNTVNLNGSVNVLKKSLIDESASDPRRPGVAQYDDEAADRAYMQQIIQQNEALAGEEGSRFIVGE